MFRKAPFTTLDLVLRDAVVDARQGTVGALNQDEIDSAVDELLQLNGRRDHSYFLAGFRDAMFERQPARKLPAENAMQMRWFMRYIRTLLSEHIRKKCGEHDIPWRFCWSPGRGGAVEAVLKAAHAGRK